MKGLTFLFAEKEGSLDLTLVEVENDEGKFVGLEMAKGEDGFFRIRVTADDINRLGE
jgi:hypothetical protein